MTAKDIFLHLRIPFSFFLMPVFWFAVSQASIVDKPRAVWVFCILHLLIYTASNAYNSYFDKDEGSIGGLEKPPAVDEKLFWVAWGVDIIAIVLGFLFVNPLFALLIFIYGMVSKAYSHDKVRLKRYAVLSWAIVGLFQGAFTYYIIIMGISNNGEPLRPHFLPALISTLMLWAIYPITQVYQHEEDSKRGDKTMSMLLGIRGTFVFTAIVFSISFLLFFAYFSRTDFLLLLVCNAPVLAYFGWWFSKVLKDNNQASFQNVMWLNLLASVCLNGFYIWLYVR